MLLLLAQKVIYINRQIGKDMHVYLVKYHVYKQLKADEHKAKTIWWEVEYNTSIWFIEALWKWIPQYFPLFICCHKLSIHIFPFVLSFLKIMSLPMIEIQCDDTYVLIYAIQIISLRIRNMHTSIQMLLLPYVQKHGTPAKGIVSWN